MNIKRVKSKNIKCLNEIITLEKKIFGDGGVNIWFLQPLSEYQLVYQCLNPSFVAYAILLKDIKTPKKAYLFSFGVSLESQNQGIGKEFLKKLIDELNELGFNHLELTVSPKNKVAIYLYKKTMKLVSSEFIKHCYGEKEDREKLCFEL
ncbi:MAG: hypothetical protein COB02_08045 [Candidatus Cloacimonadota bacterium]|nr:MAG: hypothetical protein COB02_08045 [Candidatus Cloacimonadota bacterium]